MKLVKKEKLNRMIMIRLTEEQYKYIKSNKISIANSVRQMIEKEIQKKHCEGSVKKS